MLLRFLPCEVIEEFGGNRWGQNPPEWPKRALGLRCFARTFASVWTHHFKDCLTQIVQARRLAQHQIHIAWPAARLTNQIGKAGKQDHRFMRLKLFDGGGEFLTACLRHCVICDHEIESISLKFLQRFSRASRGSNNMAVLGQVSADNISDGRVIVDYENMKRLHGLRLSLEINGLARFIEGRQINRKRSPLIDLTGDFDGSAV